MLDAKEILKYLPHRYPFLLVDRIVEISGEDKIVGIKMFLSTNLFFKAIFPRARSCQEF
jgi:3-hydroxyacyl-[acyl-carrier-protein] dehydratase